MTPLSAARATIRSMAVTVADTIEGRDGNDYIDNYDHDSDVDTVYPGKGANTVLGSYYYFNDLVVVEGEVTADTFDAHYYSYVLNGEQTNVYYNASVIFNTNGGEDVVNSDGGLPYTLIVNGLKPSISAVRLGLNVHGVFKDTGDNANLDRHNRLRRRPRRPHARVRQNLRATRCPTSLPKTSSSLLPTTRATSGRLS